MANFNLNSTKFDWRFESKWKSEKKNDSLKTKFDKFTQNFTILEEKIRSTRSERTGENAEFSNEFNEIRLKIEIEPKIRDKNHIWNRKFHNFPRENSLNQIWSDTRKCRISRWIQLNSIEDWNRRENRREIKEKKQHLTNLHKILQF